MDEIKTAFSQFLIQIIFTVLTTIIGYLCVLIRNFLKKKGIVLDTQIAANNTALQQSIENLKQSVAEQCVLFAQQKFAINERFTNACTIASGKLANLGIQSTTEEIELLIESSLKKIKVESTTVDNWANPAKDAPECNEIKDKLDP